MKLGSDFDYPKFSHWLRDNIPDFTHDVQLIDIHDADIVEAKTIGESLALNIRIFVIKTTANIAKKRIGLAKSSFSILKKYAVSNAIIAYYSENPDTWRLSLLTSTPVWAKNKVIIKVSNPRRYSYLLGKSAKTNTPQKYLISKGPIKDFEDLQSRFSLEVVNKEFYKAISHSFTQLVESQLKLPSTLDKSQINLEFAVRLIGRTIFCWFLREKISDKGVSLMPKELLSREAIDIRPDYYHSVLEPIFFEVLNKPLTGRLDDYKVAPFSSIPYLNGGLFYPQDDDYYGRGKSDIQSKYHNTLVVPDRWFKEFFDTLETYNFTIDENTSFDEELSIDPEMLGRIFENLLAEINPETGESARKSTGSYYTPRTIVNYMVDESLLLYLQEKTGIDEDKLRALISYDLTDDEEHPLTETEQEEVVIALEQVKILDPACGSGAFPMGALQKMVFILEQIDPDGQVWFKKQIRNATLEVRKMMERDFAKKNFDFIRKLNIIRENIYGVDIQPIATEISRLRCFLTLVVDQQIHEDKENRGIVVLPNLDFKFVTANSLIGLPQQTKVAQQGLFEDSTNIDKLGEVRSTYFSADPEERIELKFKFSNIQNEMLNKLIAEHRPAELTEKLATWKPFTHNLTSWFDPTWMFGIKDGFDIVIANPPYIKEYVNKSAFDGLRSSPYYQGKMDIWYMFTCKGIDFLKLDTGVLCFIAQNNWPTNYGASKMRNKIITECQMISLIDFTDYKVFEAGVQTMVFVLKKGEPEQSYQVNYAKVINKNIDLEAIQTLLSNSNASVDGALSFRATINPASIVGKNIVFSNKINDELLNKIGDKKNFALTQKEVAQGIVGDPDKAFIFSEIKDFSKSEKSMLFDYYTSVGRFHTGEHRGYVAYLNKSVSDIEKFSNIKLQLQSYTSELKNRREVKNNRIKWFNLHWPRDRKFFTSGPKIVSAIRTKFPSFYYTEEEYYGSRAMNFIKTDRISLKYLTGLLNSKLIYYWLKNRGKQLGDLLQIDKGPLMNIPIYNPDGSTQLNIVSLVENMIVLYKSYQNNQANINESKLKRDIKLCENQIDQSVYHLYGLTNDEISLVEDTLK